MRTLQFTSLNFDVSFQEIFSTWCSGGTLVLLSEEVRRDIPRTLRVLEDESIEGSSCLSSPCSNWPRQPTAVG